jgi:urease accessory protein
MSAEPSALLKALQQADSFFPSGGTAFSWGIETLIADQAVDLRRDLATMLAALLEGRWAVFDRSVLISAYRAGDVSRLAAIDAEVETMILPAELREGSRRAGASLLDVHQRLYTPGAAEYRAAVRGATACGHLNVVQGCVWHGVGMSELQAQAVGAHAFCVSVLGAAVRMGAVGHIQSQSALTLVQDRIASLVEQPAVPLEDCYAFSPQLEIAAMRHEAQAARVFVN